RARDAGVGAAVLTGAGRAFTAGMQVQVLHDLTPASAKALITSLHEAIHAVHEAPFPTIAMVNGACLGAGFELAMACDIRTAAAGARLGLPEVKVGVPSVIEAALLPALVGPGRAAEILLTGEPVDAAQALDWGLVNRVAAPDKLEAVTAEMAQLILACAPGAIRLRGRGGGCELEESLVVEAYDRSERVLTESFWSQDRDPRIEEQVRLVLEIVSPSVCETMPSAHFEEALAGYIEPVLRLPPALCPGADEAVRALAARGIALGIVSN